jgi:pimeloyl-ACP methyl ester carboxylesterase
MASSNYTQFALSEDSSFHFQILRHLSLGIYDGSDLGEVLIAANSIIPGDFESFSSSFLEVAQAVLARAKKIADSKFPKSARTAFFSAATYFRAADFYQRPQLVPEPFDIWANQTAAFEAGLATLDTPAERVLINGADFDIPGYWLAPDNEAKQRPTIIMFNGYDGSSEEQVHATGFDALTRDWNVLAIEGPGHPAVRRYQGLGFIPEWEKVVTPAVDFLLNKTDLVDPDSIALWGFSFGGLLAPRAAAVEKRLRAVFSVDGVDDFGGRVRLDFGPEAMTIYDSGDKETFDALAQRYFQPDAPTELRWGLGQGLWAFNTRSPFDFVTQTAEFTLAPVIDQIDMPVFVADAEHDGTGHGQPKRLADNLKCSTYHLFTSESFAAEHCGMGALKQQNQVAFDWYQAILDGSSTGCQEK